MIRIIYVHAGSITANMPEIFELGVKSIICA